MKDILFRTLMLKGDRGGTIVSIEKIGSQGSTDFMRINLDDGTYCDFEVLNTLDDDHVKSIIDEKTPAIVSEAVGQANIYTDQHSLTMANIVNTLYPVGSIYMSTNSTNPSSLFGVGTWEAWGSGRVPVGVNPSDPDFNDPNETGGSKSNSYTPSGSISGTVEDHQLKVDELPQHQHIIWGYNNGTVAGGGGADPNYHVIYTANMHDLPPDVTGGLSGLTGENRAHGHGFTGSFSGNALSVSTVQPYVTCYMWRRIS